jgi:hypothetical protein
MARVKCRSKFGVQGCKAGMKCPERQNPSFFVPRSGDMVAYYEATDKKHFSSDRSIPGSKFTDPKLSCLEDIVEILIHDGRNLYVDDDRNEFIQQHNANPNAFSSSCRYLKIETSGSLGAIHAADLANDTVLDVVRTKPGVPCSLVTTVQQQPESQIAVVVLADHDTTHQPFIITAFPGVPTKPIADERIDLLEGSSLTVQDAKNILGVDNFWINTRLAR